MRLLARLMCAASLVSGLTSVQAAVATQAPARVAEPTAKRECVTYKTHRACVVLHQNKRGRLWASGFVKKRSGKSTVRYVSVKLESHGCQSTRYLTRAEARDDAQGNRSAAARTAKIAGADRVYFRATIVTGWTQYNVVNGSRDYVLRTPVISDCVYFG